MHDSNKRTAAIRAIEVKGCCDKCKKVIDWKIQYKKYKPLTVPKKCVKCEGKTVLQAYTIVCLGCAVKRNICVKCTEPLSTDSASTPIHDRPKIEKGDAKCESVASKIATDSDVDSKAELVAAAENKLDLSETRGKGSDAASDDGSSDIVEDDTDSELSDGSNEEA